ncbi:MAG: ABC transporter substrate-binding protein [Bermanella sp.]
MKLFSALILLFSLSFQTFAQGDPEDALALVEERIYLLLAQIEALKVEPNVADKQKLDLVEDVIGEVVDFNRISRRVMAKYYKKATKEQKKMFFQVFKQSLLNTYAKGLWEFEDYKIRLKPLKSAHQSQRNTLVEFEVVTASGQVFPVTQSLYFNKKQKRWLVQNVIISGVNIGQLFRDQFARLVNEKNGDIDLATNAWAGILEASKTPSSADALSD